MGTSERVDRLLKAESAATAAGGTVVRLTGEAPFSNSILSVGEEAALLDARRAGRAGRSLKPKPPTSQVCTQLSEALTFST